MSVESMYGQGFRHEAGDFSSRKDLARLLRVIAENKANNSQVEQPADTQVTVEKSTSPEKA